MELRSSRFVPSCHTFRQFSPDNVMTIDPITLQVIQARLAGIVQEMQNSLFRTGYSTIIRESQDASCAILNTRGEVVAQHVVLPLHMGAFPACAAAILNNFSLQRDSPRRRLYHQPSLPRRQPPRARYGRADADLLSTANGWASPPTWRTRAISAAPCPAAARATRGRSTRRDSICRR